MQTDVKHISQKMDHDLGEKYRPAIDKLLKENGLDSVDDVINKAAAQMTPEDRKAFEAVRCRHLTGSPGLRDSDACCGLTRGSSFVSQLIKVAKSSKTVSPRSVLSRCPSFSLIVSSWILNPDRVVPPGLLYNISCGRSAVRPRSRHRHWSVLSPSSRDPRALTHAGASPLHARTSPYTGKGAINIARWAVRIVNVNAIATFFRAAESGTVAAAAGGSCSLLSPLLVPQSALTPAFTGTRQPQRRSWPKQQRPRKSSRVREI